MYVFLEVVLDLVDVFLGVVFTGTAFLAGALSTMTFSSEFISDTAYLSTGALALTLSIFTSVCA